jgi:hypothetical protein
VRTAELHSGPENVDARIELSGAAWSPAWVSVGSGWPGWSSRTKVSGLSAPGPQNASLSACGGLFFSIELLSSRR